MASGGYSPKGLTYPSIIGFCRIQPQRTQICSIQGFCIRRPVWSWVFKSCSAVSRGLWGPFCGCPYTKSPAILVYIRALDFEKLPVSSFELMMACDPPQQSQRSHSTEAKKGTEHPRAFLWALVMGPFDSGGNVIGMYWGPD